eukprot:1196275-Prorocentrum_minimum.AAC.3
MGGWVARRCRQGVSFRLSPSAPRLPCTASYIRDSVREVRRRVTSLRGSSLRAVSHPLEHQHQSRKRRENIPASGINRGRGEAIVRSP